MNMAEAKVIYHLDDQDTPYLVKLAIPADCVTLQDLKNVLNRPNYKYFFKSMDDDFGVVKEEIIDDHAVLPSFNGRIVTWLMSVDNSVASETLPQESPDEVPGDRNHQPNDDPPATALTKNILKNQKSNTDSRKGPLALTSRRDSHPNRQYHHNRSHHRKPTSSVMTSDIETTSFVDSEDDVSTRVSTTTDTTNASSYYHRHQRRSRRKMRHPVLSQASSFSSVTDSTMSLNIITVMLNMEASSFLGISIVGQTSKGGDGGIYVGSIMKGGVVAQDGRIEPGDMLLEVNGTSFENMNNDEAVRTLRQAVQGPGPITLVLAKCWDPNPKGYFTIPRQEHARPIDPSAWVLHTQAMQGMWGTAGPPSVSSVTSSSSSIISSIPENRFVHKVKRSSGTSSSSYSSQSYGELNKNTDMATIVRAMARPDSGLEVRDRTWLKITIKRSFIGSDLVDWLYTRVSGFTDRRDARRYACNLLKAELIQHTVNKVTFSEQCYYVFGNNIFTDMAALSMNDIDSISSVGDHDCKVRAFDPLPPMQKIEPYSSRLQSPGHLAEPTTMNYSLPPSAPYNFIADTNSYISMPGVNGAESIVSGSAMRDQTCACIVTHTYKQFRKLWDNSDKSNPGQKAVKMLGKFDPDIDRSTSSDTGSSDSEGNRPKNSKNKDIASGSGVCIRQQQQPSTDKMLPPGQDDDAGRVAIINSHAEEVVKEMGDL